VTEPATNPNGDAAPSGKAKTNGKTNGHVRSTAARKQGHDINGLIEQAVKLRTALHGQMHQAGELVKALKQHRRQSKAVETTLSTIRQLKSLGV
jgi:hypothetical protein